MRSYSLNIICNNHFLKKEQTNIQQNEETQQQQQQQQESISQTQSQSLNNDVNATAISSIRLNCTDDLTTQVDYYLNEVSFLFL